MRKFTSIITMCILLFSGGMYAQDLRFQINPSDPILQLYDTVTFTADIPIDLPHDSIFFYDDQRQAIMMQMGPSTFFAKRVGSSVITCDVYFGDQKYTSTTTATVTREGDPDPEKLHFLQRQIKLPVNTVASFGIAPDNADVKLGVINPRVITMDADARVVKGLNPGTTLIYAEWKGQVDSCLVKVFIEDSVVIDVLTIEPNPIRLEVGDQVTVKIDTKSLIALPIETKVENPEIADFNEEGLLTGKMAGRTWLHAVQGEYQTRALITVGQKDSVWNGSIQIQPNPIKLLEGTRTKIVLRTPYSIPFKFNVLNREVAKVSEDGVVYGLKEGRTLLVAHQGNFSDTTMVLVYKDDAEPDVPVVSVKMKPGQKTALKRLFPRMNAEMQMDIHSRGVIRMDVSLMVYAIASGRAVINFYSANERLLFRGVILVETSQRPGPEPIERVWLDAPNILMIKFREPLDSLTNRQLLNLVEVQIYRPDVLLAKNGDLIEIMNAQLMENNSVLMLELSNEIPDGAALKVTVSNPWLKNDENSVGENEYIFNLSPVQIPNIKEEIIHIYPNPATNEITISSPKPMSDVRVYNLQGKTIDVIPVASSNLISYNINHLTIGKYIVQITDTTEKVYKTSFMKQ